MFALEAGTRGLSFIFFPVRKGEALAFHSSATSGEEQKPPLPGWVCQALLWAGTTLCWSLLGVSVRWECVPAGLTSGNIKEVHPGFFWWFSLLTSYAFSAFVSLGMSKISPWTFYCTETLLTWVKQELQGCLKSLNFVPESPLQHLALNTFFFSRNSLCSAAELSALLSLLILVIMFHIGSLRRIIISFSGMQWTLQIHHFCALILLGKKKSLTRKPAQTNTSANALVFRKQIYLIARSQLF